MMIKGRLKGAGCFSDDLSVLFVLRLFAKLDVFRHFISGQLGTAEFDEFFFGQARVFFDDEDFEGFACFFVGHADTGDFHDFIIVRNNFFDFVRINVETGNDDKVFFTVNQFQPAFFVHDGDVAGFEEAARVDGFGGFFGPVPIALHHLRAFHPHFARLPLRHGVAL